MRPPGRRKLKEQKIEYATVLRDKDEFIKELESDNRTLRHRVRELEEVNQELEERVEELEINNDELEGDNRQLMDEVENLKLDLEEK